jgi:acetyl-CoA decarbonylase/synthase complex subunit gamma
MALSGLDIFKLLPKTNCGDCDVPTCMAFAMKLAQKKAELSECPHASEEAKETLGAASEPPIRLVKIGGANALEVGNETVMFRHEKTFFHQTGMAVELRTSEGEKGLLAKVKEVEEYVVERVGEELQTDLFFITHDSKESGDFLATIKLVKQNSNKGMILECVDEGVLREGVEFLKDDRPAVLLKRELSDDDIELAKASNATLILTAQSLDELAGQAEKARNSGLNDMILNLEAENVGHQLQNNTILRRGALKKNFKPFGYPLISFIRANSKLDLLAKAALQMCKYGSIIVLPEYDKALLYTLFTLRQNIYTDPQKPIQVDPKVYPIGEPGPESPVFVTTNFSLTYFIVSGEIENSGISAHLVVAEAEGQSVLTAWASGKFVGETIAKFIKDIKLEEQVKTRKIVIPGFVASDIASFVKSVKLT